MTDPLLSFAQVALGELAIGIDTRHVVRAVARPPRLTRLPRSHGAIDGVFADGAQAIPVVDLRKWMGEPADDAPAQAPSQVLVLGAEGRMIGLAIDAVRGLVRAKASQLRRIHHEDTEDDFFHSVVPSGDGALLSLLDPLRLMERVRAWTAADEPEGAALDEGVKESAAPAPQMALVRIGATLLALPASLVAQVLERPPAQPVLGSGRELLGMMVWRGGHLPLLDLAAVLGLDAGAAPLAMVLADGGMQVALPIDEVAAVRPLPAQASVAAGEAGIAHPLVGGVALQDDGERILLLDGGALLRAYATPGLAQQEAGADSAGGSGQRAAAHVVVDAGRRWAIPMSALEEILPLPAGPGEIGGGDGLPSTFAWRGRSLPLVDLREPREGGKDGGPQRLVVARHGARHAALRVNDVVELLPAQLGELLQFQLAGGARMRMITVGQNAVGQASARTSYTVLDLGALPCFTPA
jgi:chemotaxis signal transduction protein